MGSRNLLRIFALITFAFNFKESLGLICFESFSINAGWRFCWSTPKNADSCRDVSNNVTSSLLSCYGYPDIKTPRIAITVDNGSTFNVTLKNGRKIPNVRLFLTMAEKTEVDIELEHSNNYSISCQSLGSLSKVSTNIIKSKGRTSKKFNVTYDYLTLSAFSELTISKGEIISGRFICRSTGDQYFEETFKIFAKKPEWPLKSFVPHHDSTIQSDEKGNGFIIPCRTNERLQIPPMLMISENGEELSPLGSLEKHLRIIKPAGVGSYVNTTKSQYYSTDELSQKLLGFCEQIAFAMEHLENKKVIHGDLAARNVLVFNHGIVKVTDFGYSRQLYENNVYKPNTTRALPWRWASIELLRAMEFSTESDIWAFGITVWEIFTFGNVPFANEKWTEHFMESLDNALRLKKPAGMSESQYTFLKECWHLEKSVRPRFPALKSFFSEKENLHYVFPTTSLIS